PTSCLLYRKSRDAVSWGASATLAANATNYVDTSVVVGSNYEYRILISTASYSSYGYIYTGIETPLVESRGKVILLVDNTQAASLAGELSRLQDDLVGDGWTVLRHDVSRTTSVTNIKAIITADYNADPVNVKSLFIFGRVPVPYSGSINPDGHFYRAFPADVYYGELTSAWTDTQTLTGNNPGDGKFDQSYLPSDMELQVGRVDLANMPAFAKGETELLRQYLNKDHNFRHKIITAEPRGLIDDNFGVMSGEAFCANGWRDGATFFGASNVFERDWLTTLATNSYLWADGCGSGSETSCNGVGTTAQFATNDPRVVFTELIGSYFGNWDTQNNLMRATLGTPSYTLTCAWVGRPWWFFHHMAQGDPIGFSTRLSQNNSGLYSGGGYGTGWRFVHVALMGDPTLRLHPVGPPSVLVVADNGFGGVDLSWAASSDTILGYHVYRATNSAGPFTNISGALVAATNYTDAAVPIGTYSYMVRAVKLETAASGTYLNPSQGVLWAHDRSNQTITFAAIPDQVTIGSVSLSATASSGLPVSFAVGAGPGQLSGGANLTFTGAGLVSIVASQAGNTNWNAAPNVTRAFNVTKVAQTSLTFIPASPQTHNTTNALSVTGGNGTGAVSFVVLGGPGQIVSSSNLWVTSGQGIVTVQVTKAADDLYNISASATAEVTCIKADQTITFPAIPAQALVNGTLALSASASSGLTVSFANTGPGTIVGNVMTFNSVGENTVVASQAGDVNYNAAADVARTFPVFGSSPMTNTIPFSDNFENYFNIEPLINGTNGWYGSLAQIVAQRSVAYSGIQAAMIPVDCTLSNRFVPASTSNVWIQMDVCPMLYESPNPPVVNTNEAVMFYINSNGNFVVHNGPATNSSPTNSLSWVTLTNCAINTNGTTWVTIGIYENFSTKSWDLYTNSTLLTNNIGFINTGLTNFAGFDVYNAARTSYMDNVSVVYSNQDEAVEQVVAITNEPVSQISNPGTAASFTVGASGTAPLYYQWQKNTVNIGSATSATYTIPSVASGDAGSYRCLVSNMVNAVTSALATLTVNAPAAITTQPISLTNNPGSSASFTVVASGTAPLYYQWQKNTVNIGSATNATYTIGSVASGDAGNYRCLVSNVVNAVTSAVATLMVNTPAAITTQPVSQTN
ncbi:MAG: immunoglobulin domain-containing protein, partial [Kiritimatiellae bacterium]|nr:immunoglobulin domain-containing protein [Kiritimatiellia bacterium]